MSVRIGCVADDFTGATDVAAALAQAGLDTALLLRGEAGSEQDDAEAIVVALKIRSAPADEAVAGASYVARNLLAAGCERIFFKYCSTFDSTDAGNIGPVSDALLDLTGAGTMIVCPAVPAYDRTIYQGHLFVGSSLLSDTPMRNHPLTPMTDSSLVRLLGRQAKARVGLLPLRTVRAGPQSVRAALGAAHGAGCPFMVADALCDADLDIIAAACIDSPLASGAAGLAASIGRALAAPGGAGQRARPAPRVPGYAAIVSGSASAQTRRQVEHFARHGATYVVDPAREDTEGGLERAVSAAVGWAAPRLGQAPVLIAADTRPERIAALQERLGVLQASALVETLLAEIAFALVEMGVRKLLVAGGETSGAVASRLGLRRLRVGPLMAPGVPWNFAPGPMAIGLKSGNFGPDDLFSRAFRQLGGETGGRDDAAG
jgi:3-dehydrotetronate 4-kinase